MNDRRNVEIVQSIYEAYQRGDRNAVMSMIADDAEIIRPGSRAEIPYAGTWHGRREIEEFYKVVDEAIEFIEFEPQQFHEHGDWVVVFGRDRSRVKGTGQEIQTEWVHVVTMHDGKVLRSEHFDQVDRARPAFAVA